MLSAADVAALAAVALCQCVAAWMGMWAYSLFTLPGTAGHEAAHWLVAVVLGGRPSFPSLIPQRTRYGWRLGSVEFAAGFVRAVPIALAPLLLAPAGLWWAGHFLPVSGGGWYAAHAWVAGTLVLASLPSRRDWAVAAPFILLVIAMCVAVWWLTRS